MSDKEKLVELLMQLEDNLCDDCGREPVGCAVVAIADHLITNGVTMQEWIPASEPPTQKDADKYGRVLAMEMGMMALVNYKAPINYPDRFPYWMPLPAPKGE